MADNKEQDVQGLESYFRRAMQFLEWTVNSIHFAQLSAITKTVNILRGADLDILRGSAGNLETLDGNATYVAPHASALPAGVGAMNVYQFACAIEKPPLLSFTAFGCPSVKRKNRSKVMTEVANATRPDWPAKRPFFPYHINILFLMDFMFDTPDGGISIPLMHNGTAKLVDSTSRGQLEDGKHGREGKVVGADEHGMVFSFKDHAAMILPYEATIFSDKNGGKHTPNGAHDGNKHEFDGVNAKEGFSCLFNNNCFIKFRANDKNDKEWGQPNVYSFTSQELDKWGSGNAKNPWELNDKGSLKLTHGGNGTAEMSFKPGKGYAMSKAMVYYHRLGDWREQPNLFNPYWRAKLHPFDKWEAAGVLAASGDGDAAKWGLLAATGMVPLN